MKTAPRSAAALGQAEATGHLVSPSGHHLTSIRHAPWRAGIALAAAAYGLQALALAFGPLALVAPIVATDLLFAMPLAAWWSRRPMRRRDWAGCALVASGIGIFLATSPPSS